jgi:lipid II:glycine glycyltransferase (peptidoglycan interpeptide bridge formation enzyme)
VHRRDLGAELVRRGFDPSPLEAAPVATVLVDLARDDDRLLGAFRASARSNIRKAERRGVNIRVGDESDLATFARLVDRTGRRQSFAPYPPSYYERMWRLFAETGHSRLLLAEHEGRVLSGVLVIGFGDTAVYKMGGWSGERRDIHPNELAHWHAMRWAREVGHRYYDLEGIPVSIARALLRGETPEGARHGTPRFKLGFGGEVRLYPGAFDRGRPRFAGTLARRAAPRLLPVTQRLAGRGRR